MTACVRWGPCTVVSRSDASVTHRLLNDPLLLLLRSRVCVCVFSSLKVAASEQQWNGHTCCVRRPNFILHESTDCRRKYRIAFGIATKMRSRAAGKRVAAVVCPRRTLALKMVNFLRARQKVRIDDGARVRAEADGETKMLQIEMK